MLLYYLAATEDIAENFVRLDLDLLSVLHHIQKSPVMSWHLGVRLHVKEEAS